MPSHLRIPDLPTLVQKVGDWLNREDLANQIPDFIQLAEVRLNRELRWRKMIVRDTVAVDEEYEDLPPGFLEVKSIRFNTKPPTFPTLLLPQQMERERARGYGSGAPRHYAIVGNQLLFDRVPSGQEMELATYVEIPSLTEDQPVNQLLVEHPDLYLFGALLEAEAYLKHDPRLEVWAARFGQALAAVHRADKQAERSAGPLVFRFERTF